MSRSQVLKYRLRYQMQNVQAKVAHRAQVIIQGMDEVYHKLYEQLQDRLKKIADIEKNIAALKKTRSSSTMSFNYKRRIKTQKIRLAYQWSKLKLALKVWHRVLKLT